MTRVLARLCLLLGMVAMTIVAVPQIASAQDADAEEEEDPVLVVVNTQTHTTTGRGVHFIIPDVQPGDGDTGTTDDDADDTDDSDATGGTGGGDSSDYLALTGSDVEPIVALSLGLLAVGSSVLVMSRRRMGLFD